MSPRKFLGENEEFLGFLGQALGRAALRNPAVSGFDIREALEASIRTHRTLQSGLVYESLPANPLAADSAGLSSGDRGVPPPGSRTVGNPQDARKHHAGLLVFLQHFEMSYNNGRPRGRAFLDALLDFYSAEAETAAAPAPPL
jgi:hypothetical protein